jgi:hypothetical protein
MVKIILEQAEKNHDANQLQDALKDAGMLPVRTRHWEDKSEFVFADVVEEADARAVIAAYTPAPKRPPTDFKALMANVDEKIAAAEGATATQFRAAAMEVFKSFRVFMKARAGLPNGEQPSGVQGSVGSKKTG